MVSFCGLDCSTCPAFVATKEENEEFKIKTAKAWSKTYKADIKPEDILCYGCHETDSEKLFSHCKVCEIRRCGIAKEVKNCAFCDDYICEKLATLFQYVPDAKTTLEKEKSEIK